MTNRIEELRSQINEHHRVIAEWEAKLRELRMPPVIPPGASSQRITEIFEAAAGRDGTIVGTEAALIELRRRESALVQQLEARHRQ